MTYWVPPTRFTPGMAVALCWQHLTIASPYWGFTIGRPGFYTYRFNRGGWKRRF